MIDSKIEAIIFDFGGVLINLDYERTIKAFKSLGIENFHQLYSQATQENLFDDIETGAIRSAEFISGIMKYLPNDTSTEQVIEAWNAMILDVPHSTIDLLQSIQDKYRIFLLSNTNEIHLPYALEKWYETTDTRFEKYFEKTYLSYEMGMRKPNKEIFEFVCNENSLDPRRTLFIDDSVQHLEGAKQVNLQTHHLDSIQMLSKVFS